MKMNFTSVHVFCHHILMQSHCSAPHSSVMLAPLQLTGSLCTFLHCHFQNATANTSSASRLIISTCALQIQLGPSLPSCYMPSTAEIIFGSCSNLLHNINIFFCHEPSRLRLSDKLTEVTDNSFDSKLQLSVVPRAPLAGVCCDRRARRSSPTVISVGPDDKDIMQRVFKHEADM